MILHKPLEYPSTFIKHADRMELIKSEARLPSRPASRATSKNKDLAIAAAENPHLSRVAECLLRTNVSEGRGLKTQLINIQREHSRRMYDHQLARQAFLNKSWTLNHQPAILLERPSPAGVETKVSSSDQANLSGDTDARNKFQKTLHVPACTRMPAVPSTIDLFVRVRKKKLNIWEEEGPGDKKEFNSNNAKSLRERDLTELKAAYGVPTGEVNKTNPTKSVYGNLLSPFHAYQGHKNAFSASSSSFSWSLASDDMMYKYNLRPHTSFRRLASVAKQVSGTKYRSVRSAPVKAGNQSATARHKTRLI